MIRTDREPFTPRTAAVFLAACGGGDPDLVLTDAVHRAVTWEHADARYSAWGDQPDGNLWRRLWQAHRDLAAHVGDPCPTCWNPDTATPAIAGHAPLKACDHCGATCRCNCDAAADWHSTGGY